MTEITLRRRSLPDQLRFLARQLDEGVPPVAVIVALHAMADQLQPEDGRGECQVCHRRPKMRMDGTVRAHNGGPGRGWCRGSQLEPVPA